MVAVFRKLFSKTGPTAAPAVPEGHRIYAIGDIHGRRDLLDECLSQVHADIDARPPASNVLVFLGDYVDRGPDSAGVIERLRRYERRGVRTIFLGGNHEEVLLRLLRGEAEFLSDWLRFGGAECARSYKLDPDSLARAAPARAVAELREAIPREHQAFLASLSDTIRIGGYLFVHAGIRPGIDLAEQAQSDLRWIREPFLDDSTDHGFVVVHGHTITNEVEVASNRIGIDTGAFCTGTLTAFAVDGSSRWLLQTVDGETQRVALD